MISASALATSWRAAVIEFPAMGGSNRTGSIDHQQGDVAIQPLNSPNSVHGGACLLDRHGQVHLLAGHVRHFVDMVDEPQVPVTIDGLEIHGDQVGQLLRGRGPVVPPLRELSGEPLRDSRADLREYVLVRDGAGAVGDDLFHVHAGK